MGIEELIIKQMQEAVADIRANMQAKGINASGRTSASVHVRTSGNLIELVGGGENTAPFPTVEVGRAGGNVPAGFYRIIKEWSRVKGISFETEGGRSRFAYFTARKIARQGTQRHMQPVDVYSETVKRTAAKIDTILQRWLLGRVQAEVRMNVH